MSDEAALREVNRTIIEMSRARFAKPQAIGGLKLGRLLWMALPFGGGGLVAWFLTHWAGPKPPMQ